MNGKSKKPIVEVVLYYFFIFTSFSLSNYPHLTQPLSQMLPSNEIQPLPCKNLCIFRIDFL